ncbi:TPA: hypothetical protein ACJTSB_001571 [Streptococcus pyogenes]
MTLYTGDYWYEEDGGMLNGNHWGMEIGGSHQVCGLLIQILTIVKTIHTSHLMADPYWDYPQIMRENVGLDLLHRHSLL